VKLRVEKGPKGTTKLQQVLGTCEDTAFEQDQIDELEIWDIFFSSNNTEAASIPADGFCGYASMDHIKHGDKSDIRREQGEEGWQLRPGQLRLN
jgi:hypothetical protein